MKKYGFVLYMLIAVLILGAWACVMFRFSAQSGAESGAVSAEVADVFMRIIHPETPPDRTQPEYEKVHYLVRKLAHFTEYAVLAMLLALVFAPLRMKLAHKILLIVLLCASFAGLDEWHQSFVEGRGPALLDVLIDTLGAAFGAALSLLFRKLAIATANRGILWRKLRE